MDRQIRKPQMKNEEVLIKSEYPEKIQQTHQWVCENLNETQISDMNNLIDRIYKTAYLDGFKDALYYQEIYPFNGCNTGRRNLSGIVFITLNWYIQL